MVQLMVKGTSKKEGAGVSSFQALMMSVASRVGTGNIAGVATAIVFGGPGAIFWMWLVAILGAATAFIESTLAQIYKEKHGKEFRGGPAYYIEKGLKNKPLAMVFAFIAMIAFGAFLNMPQANTIASSAYQAFGMSKYLTALIITGLFAIIVFGGVKRIASFTEKVVPFMAIAYLVVALVIIVSHIQDLPSVFGLILASAFRLDSLMAGMVGSAIAWGVKRGVYSNEAGMGTAPHAAAAAQVDHPVEQGLVQSLSVYIDTLFICTATALMILITDSYNVVGASGDLIVDNLGQVAPGPIYTQVAVDSLLRGWGPIFVSVAIFFFAFTTMISLYYYGETNLVYMVGKEKSWPKTLLRLFVILALAYGALKSSGLIWGFADLGMGLSAWINILVILCFHKPALIALKDYDRQLAAGISSPQFKPLSLNIQGADYWQ